MKKNTSNLLKFIIVLIVFITLVLVIIKLYNFVNLNSLKIIIINLKRTADRKKHMENKMKKLNLSNYIFFEAVDGKHDLHKYNYKIMDIWFDPHNKTYINEGEIGCALSHHLVWKYIVENNISKALILEDDTIFKTNFKEMYKKIINMNIDYDMLYLSRNPLNNLFNLGPEENYNELLVKSKYSHNLDGYIITKAGCQKLLQTNFIYNLIVVDEFLPIMYDVDYPYKKFSKYFEKYEKLKTLALKNTIIKQDKTYGSTIVE